MVLIMRSAVFRASLTGDFQVQYATREGKQYRKIVIVDIESASFKVFLKFLYTDKLDADAKSIMGVLHAGKFKCFYTLIFSQILYCASS